MVAMRGEDLRRYIRNVPDFPKKGIMFRDITTLLQDEKAFRASIETLRDHYKDIHVNKIVSIESRGFIFGSALAYEMNAGFVPVRKINKLPAKTIREEYQLEYGSDALEMHVDAIVNGDRVLVVDDLIATGGTAVAACNLVRRLGGTIIGIAALIELSFLHPREKLKEYDLYSVITYDSE